MMEQENMAVFKVKLSTDFPAFHQSSTRPACCLKKASLSVLHWLSIMVVKIDNNASRQSLPLSLP
jgi:hypothetical protein